MKFLGWENILYCFTVLIKNPHGSENALFVGTIYTFAP